MGVCWLFWTGFATQLTIKGSPSFGQAILSLFASQETEGFQLFNNIQIQILFENQKNVTLIGVE